MTTFSRPSTSSACWGNVDKGNNFGDHRYRQEDDDDSVNEPTIKEEPSLIETSLYWFEKDFNEISSNRNLSNELVRIKNTKWIQNRKLRLMFLRTNQFDSRKATKQFLLHFHYKKDLFGDEMSCKSSITLDDLSEDDQACIRCGHFQIVGTDNGNERPIICIFSKQLKSHNICSMIRAMWYIVMKGIENDEDTQRKGFDIITIGTPNSNTIQLLQKLFLYENGLPIRIRAHYWFLLDHEKLNPLVKTFLLRVGFQKTYCKRQNFYFEDHPMRCLYDLYLLGINPEMIPLGYDGTILIERHLKLIEAWKLEESSQSKPEGSRGSPTRLSHAGIVPNDHDVLLGNGKAYRLYPGNVTLEKLITSKVLQSYMKAAVSTPQFDNTYVVLGVIQQIQTMGGRFLIRSEKGECGWMVATDSVVQNDVRARFRTQLRQLTSQNLPNSTNAINASELSEKSVQSRAREHAKSSPPIPHWNVKESNGQDHLPCGNKKTQNVELPIQQQQQQRQWGERQTIVARNGSNGNKSIKKLCADECDISREILQTIQPNHLGSYQLQQIQTL